MSKSIYKTFSSYKSNILKDKRSNKLIFNIDGRNHYVYRITDIKKSKHYYGCRITTLEPISDLGIKYFSSSSVKEFISEQKKYPQNFKYKIIKIFDNKIDMMIFESYLHSFFNVMKSNNFYNKTNSSIFQIGIINYLNINVGDKNGRFAGYFIFNNMKYGSAIELSKLLNCHKSFINRICKNNNKFITLRIYNNQPILQSFGTKEKIIGKTYKELGFNFIPVKIKRHQKTNGIGVNHHSFNGHFIYKNVKYESAVKLSKKINVTSKTVKNWCVNCNKLITLMHYSQSSFLKNNVNINDISKLTFKDIGFDFCHLSP